MNIVIEKDHPLIGIPVRDLQFVADMAERLAEEAICHLQYDGLDDDVMAERTRELERCMDIARAIGKKRS